MLAEDPAQLLLWELVADHHRHPGHHDDQLPTLDLADLSRVTGGAGDDLSSMLLPMMMMMRNRSQAQAAPVPAPATVPPWQPKITVDGVPQQVTSSENGTYTVST